MLRLKCLSESSPVNWSMLHTFPLRWNKWSFDYNQTDIRWLVWGFEWLRVSMENDVTSAVDANVGILQWNDYWLGIKAPGFDHLHDVSRIYCNVYDLSHGRPVYENFNSKSTKLSPMLKSFFIALP